MTTTMGKPRPDHIAALTKGYHLPLDPLASQHIAIILETVSRAWRELCGEGAVALTSGIEAEVNALLGPRLNRFRDFDPLWAALVSSVAQGRESINYNGTKLEPRPDMTFVLTRRNANFPLVAECKIIDHPNGKTVGLYCSKGIARFVRGDYAWASREAIMLGYVRDGSSVPLSLAPQLTSSAKASPDPLQTTSHPRSRADIHLAVHLTQHQRKFSYTVEVDGTGPGPINLFHLWL